MKDLDPNTNSKVSSWLNEGFMHHSARRMDEAELFYRNVLSVQPDNADALHLLGVVIGARGLHDQAVELIRQAIAQKPQVAEFHNNLGTTLGDLDRTLEAETAFRQAVALKSNYAEAHRNLGLSLRKQGRLEEAVIAFRKATEHRQNYGEALANLAATLRELGESNAAADAERKALEIQGGPPEAYSTLGLDLRKLRRLEQAVDLLRQAVKLSPEDPFVHFNLALVLLEAGQYSEGFVEYEWRWRLPDFSTRRRNFSKPPWDGSNLKGRTILIYTEQGLGTNIQFVRYVTSIARSGGRVILQCPPALARLFATVPGVLRVNASIDQPEDAFDVHAPMASLPRLLKTTLQTIPNEIPYFRLGEDHIGTWLSRFPENDKVMKVGLVWAGNQKPDPARTCPLNELARLRDVKGVQFYSLQKGNFAIQHDQPPPIPLIDLSTDLKDFADTAAAISQLDLVISVDTSVAHLAGALGKPVWTLLPYLADWRWLVNRSDTPWYPTMRLFRQPRQGEWGEVLDCVAKRIQTESLTRRAL
jgi:tetratricopeptide (TPR) repeat protein